MAKRASVNVRLVFEGQLMERLNALREYYSVESYADLVRYLVTDSYQRLGQESVVMQRYTDLILKLIETLKK